jgi:hypothetical protein
MNGYLGVLSVEFEFELELESESGLQASQTGTFPSKHCNLLSNPSLVMDQRLLFNPCKRPEVTGKCEI